MEPLLVELLECLDLEPKAPDSDGRDLFRGRCERRRRSGPIFGGQVLSQALMAAGRTALPLPVHSIHALFLRAGNPDQNIDFEVERLRDGRSFSARRVVARQAGTAILTLQASFHAEEPGYEHQLPVPVAPDPESLPSFRELVEKMRPHFPDQFAEWAGNTRPLEFRFAVPPSYMGGEPSLDPSLTWFRAESELPDDPLLHQCLLAYASDVGLNDNAFRPHSGPDEPALRAMSTVDHAMWFHTPARVDAWTLYFQESPRATRGRGFARGAMYARDGTLIASMGQDSVMRPTSDPGVSSPRLRS